MNQMKLVVILGMLTIATPLPLARAQSTTPGNTHGSTDRSDECHVNFVDVPGTPSGLAVEHQSGQACLEEAMQECEEFHAQYTVQQELEALVNAISCVSASSDCHFGSTTTTNPCQPETFIFYSDHPDYPPGDLHTCIWQEGDFEIDEDGQLHLLTTENCNTVGPTGGIGVGLTCIVRGSVNTTNYSCSADTP